MFRKRKVFLVLVFALIYMASTILAFAAEAEDPELAAAIAQIPEELRDQQDMEDIYVNTAMLEHLLNERYWVVETILGDQTSLDNPYLGGASYMDQAVLEHYENSKLMKLGVWAYYAYENGSDLLEGIPAWAMDLLVPDADWSAFVDGVKGSNYDSILGSCFTVDYVSKSGRTMEENELDLSILDSISTVAHGAKDALGWIKDTASTIKDINTLVGETKSSAQFAEQAFGMRYSFAKYVENVDKAMKKIESAHTKPQPIDTTTLPNLYDIAYYADHLDEKGEVQKKGTYYTINSLTQSVGNVAKFTKYLTQAADGTINNIMIINAMLSQNQELGDYLFRWKNTEGGYNDKRFRRILAKYADLYEDEDAADAVLDSIYYSAASTLASYGSGLAWKEGTGKVQDFAIARVAQLLDKKRTAATKRAIGSAWGAYSTALGVVSTAIDVGTGFNDLSEGIIKLEYLKDIKGYAKEVYNEDKSQYSRYKKAGEAELAERYAKRTLYDLNMLKRLTAVQNELGYNTLKAMAESPLVKLSDMWSGYDSTERLKENYENIQNAIVEAWVNPFHNDLLEVDGGTIEITVGSDGTVLAKVIKDDDTSYYIHEFEYQMAAGVALTNAHLVLKNYSDYDVKIGGIQADEYSSVEVGTMNGAKGKIIIGAFGDEACCLYQAEGSVFDVQIDSHASFSNGIIVPEDGRLSVKGNLTIWRGGYLEVEGTLEVGRDLIVSSAPYSVGPFTINPNRQGADPKARVFVGGNLFSANRGRVQDEFNSAVLEVKGNVTLGGRWLSSDCEWVFSGEKEQEIDTTLDSEFDTIHVTGAGIRIVNEFAIARLSEDLCLTGGKRYQIGDWNNHNVKVIGDGTFASLNVPEGCTAEVTGNAMVEKGLYLQGTLTVAGNLETQNLGADALNMSGTAILNVGGNLAAWLDSGGFEHHVFTINGDEKKKCQLNVDGDIAFAYAYAHSELKNAVIRVKGDVAASCSWETEGCEWYFAGTRKQRVDTKMSAPFDTVHVPGAGIEIVREFEVHKLTEDLTITGGEKYHITDMNRHNLKVIGDAVFSRLEVPEGSKAEVTGNVKVEGWLVLQGTLTVAGDLEAQSRISGALCMSGTAILNVGGNLSAELDPTEIQGQVFFIDGNEQKKCQLNVDGDIKFGYAQGYSELKNARIRVKGDVTSGCDWVSEGCEWYFAGTRKQHVGGGVFDSIQVSENGLELDWNITMGKLLSDVRIFGQPVEITVLELNGFSVYVNGVRLEADADTGEVHFVKKKITCDDFITYGTCYFSYDGTAKEYFVQFKEGDSGYGTPEVLYVEIGRELEEGTSTPPTELGWYEVHVHVPEGAKNYDSVCFLNVMLIEPGHPEYAIPQDLEAGCGKKLGEVPLPEGFAWMNAEQKLGDLADDAFHAECMAKYIPKDTNHYVTEENICIPVSVQHNWSRREGAADSYTEICKVCGVTCADGSLPAINGISLSLGGQLGFHFYLDLPVYMLYGENSYVMINDRRYLVREAIATENGYCFTYYASAKEINEDIRIAVYVCGDKRNLSNESAADGIYTARISEYLEMLRGLGDDSLTALAEAVYAYGCSAQTYFKYGDYQDIAVPDLEDCDLREFEEELEGELGDGFVYAGSSLILESTTAIRHYFEGNPGNSVCLIDGEEAELVSLGANRYYVEIADIPMNLLAYAYCTEISCGGNQMLLKYSALSYMNSVLSGDSQEMANLARAMKQLYNAGCVYQYN